MDRNMDRAELERRGWDFSDDGWTSAPPGDYGDRTSGTAFDVYDAAIVEEYKDAALSAERERVVGLVKAAISWDGEDVLIAAIRDGRTQ